MESSRRDLFIDVVVDDRFIFQHKQIMLLFHLHTQNTCGTK